MEVCIMDYLKIANRIRQKRMELSLTQEQLAEKAGITLNFLGCIECGNKRGSFETYIKIANALDTTLDSLLQDLMPAAKDNVDRQELLHYFDKLSSADKSFIIKMTADLYMSHRQ